MNKTTVKKFIKKHIKPMSRLTMIVGVGEATKLPNGQLEAKWMTTTMRDGSKMIELPKIAVVELINALEKTDDRKLVSLHVNGKDVIVVVGNTDYYNLVDTCDEPATEIINELPVAFLKSSKAVHFFNTTLGAPVTCW